MSVFLPKIVMEFLYGIAHGPIGAMDDSRWMMQYEKLSRKQASEIIALISDLSGTKFEFGTQEWYMEHPDCCPHCGSSDVVSDDASIGTKTMWQTMECDHCHSTWKGKYYIYGFDELVVPESNNSLGIARKMWGADKSRITYYLRRDHTPRRSQK